MSFNIEEYNRCIERSENVGKYYLKQPIKDGCYTNNVDMRIQKQNWFQDGGNSVQENIVDVDSDLKNINRNLSKCQVNEYEYESQFNNLLYTPPPCDNNKFLKQIHTKLESCKMREMGINRWETLCRNPQDNVNIPFEWNIDTRMLIKDNHRPCIPKLN